MSKSKYTNEYKKEILEKGIDREVAKLKRQQYIASCEKQLVDDYDGVVELVVVNGLYNDFLDYCKEFPPYDCAMRLNESKKKKAIKVKDKIFELVMNNNAIFITLTFNDDTLAKTSAITRRRYVARYLKENSDKYVANIDYGAKNGREHYHAICNNDIDLSLWHKYGAIKVERVRTTQNDLSRVALYVSKLTNHALKVGEAAPRLIYSRDVC